MPTARSLRASAAIAAGHGFGHRLADRAMRGDERRRHAEQIGLRLIAVDDNAAIDVVGAARHLGQPRHHEASGARLGCRNPESAAAQQLPHHLLHRLALRAEQIAAERRADLCNGCVERAMPLLGSSARYAVRCSSIWPSDARIVVVIFVGAASHSRIERLHLLFDVRLALSGDAQHAAEQPGCPARDRAGAPG